MKHLSLKLSRRILSLLVAAVIVLSGIPVTAADENLPAGYEYATSGATSGDNGAADGDPNVAEADDADTDEQEPVPDDEADTPVATPETTSAPIGIAPTAINYTSISTPTTLNSGDTVKGTISANVTVPDGATVTVTDTLTISGDVTISGGGTLLRGFAINSTRYLIEVDNSASLTLENITVDGNGSNYSGGSLVHVNGGTFDMYDDAVLCNNKTGAFRGGGIYVSTGGTFNMYGGEVLRNSTSGSDGGAGGVYVNTGGTFNMYSGTISNNYAGSGGGVCIFSGGTFNMSGGTISENTAYGYGFGYGYGNGLECDGTFNISGSAKISGVSMNSGTITISGPLNDDARIGIEDSSGTVATGADKDYSDCFYIANATGKIGAYNGFALSGTNIVLITLTYDISLNPAANKTFTAATYGYGAQSAHSVTVSNSGNQPTGALTAELSGTNADSFTLSKTEIDSIASGGNDSFTVTPNTGLAAGTYTATVTVSGGNNIEKSFNVSFTVNQAPLTISGFDISKAYDGNNTVSGLGTLTFSGLQNSETATVDTAGITATYNNANAGTGKAITFSGSFGMTGGTAIASNYTITQPTGITGSITKATPDGAWPDGLTATYGQALSEISLTSHTALGGVAGVFSWTTPTDKVGNVGAQSHNLTFTPTAAANYNTVTQDVTVTVGVKATTFNIDTITAQTYTGSAQTPAPVVKDGGTTLTKGTDYTVSYTNNINAGTANVSVTGMGNYAGSTGNATFTINKAVYGDKTASTDVRAGQATTNASLTLPALPAGASYPSSGTANGTLISAHSISGRTLTFSTTGQAAGNSATIMIWVSGAPNYGAYNVVVTITARAANDDEMATADLDALTFDDIKKQNTAQGNITGDLTLITEGKVYQSAITWAATPSGYIAADGTVTRPANSAGDKVVTLTATVTNGSASKTKTFPLTVKKVPAVTGEVGGEVTDDGGSPVEHITVSIMTGGTNGTLIGSTLTDENGIYNFTGLPYGVYSLVAESGGVTVTKLITINQARIIQDMQMPSGNQNTQVEVVGDTPSVAVANLDDAFTPSDKIISETQGASVEVKLVVQVVATPKNPGDAGKVDEKLGDKTLGFYLDAELLKTITGAGTSNCTDDPIQPPSGTKLEIVIDVPPALQNLAPYSIIRVHGSDVKIIPADYDSTLHTLTFDADLFSTYALAYTSSNPNPSGPPSGGGSSGGGSSSGSGGGAGASTTISTYWIEKSEAKAMAKSAKEQGADIARSRRATITGIRKASLAILADAGLRYQHDTVANNAVQVRVSVDAPAAATKDILVSGYVTGDAVNKTKTIFGKWFPNKVAVISFDQQGDFGMQVQIAAKVDLSGMDTSNLYFYSYDKATNKYKSILTEYRVDSKGYLHFATVLAGSIAVTDRPLSGDTEPQNPGTGGDISWDINDLQNPNTGGDGIGMFAPPTQAQVQPQGSVTAEALSEAAAVDGDVLRLERRTVPAAIDNTGVHITDAAVFNLDAPAEIASDKKLNVWLIGGLGVLMLLVAAVLWTAIPRKNDMADSRK